MKINTREMILVALFAALTAIGAFIKIPTPIVPFTLQFLFCAYSGILLGANLGLISQILYVGIGLVGVPVFTQGGGITYIFKPTFGYLLGFIICAYVIGRLTENMKKITFSKLFISALAGLTVVYSIGVPYLYMIIKYYLNQEAFTIGGAIAAGFTPFILADFIWCIVIAVTGTKIIPVLRRGGYIKREKKEREI